MWISKYERDEKQGVDSPIPTQVVSNEEFIPRPQTEEQKRREALIGEMAKEKSRALWMNRRDFMRSSMEMATAFYAANQVYGNYREVDEKETLEKAAHEEKWPKGDYFIFDVQTHFTNGVPLGMGAFTNLIVKGLGVKLDNKVESYSFNNFVKEIFFDSDTTMAVISGIPGKEFHRGRDGKLLEGPKRGEGILPSWLMSQSKQQLNEISGSKRVLCQGNCAPNHYWDRKNKKPNFSRSCSSRWSAR